MRLRKRGCAIVNENFWRKLESIRVEIITKKYSDCAFYFSNKTTLIGKISIYILCLQFFVNLTLFVSISWVNSMYILLKTSVLLKRRENFKYTFSQYNIFSSKNWDMFLNRFCFHNNNDSKLFRVQEKKLKAFDLKLPKFERYRHSFLYIFPKHATVIPSFESKTQLLWVIINYFGLFVKNKWENYFCRKITPFMLKLLKNSKLLKSLEHFLLDRLYSLHLWRPF